MRGCWITQLYPRDVRIALLIALFPRPDRPAAMGSIFRLALLLLAARAASAVIIAANPCSTDTTGLTTCTFQRGDGTTDADGDAGFTVPDPDGSGSVSITIQVTSGSGGAGSGESGGGTPGQGAVVTRTYQLDSGTDLDMCAGPASSA